LLVYCFCCQEDSDARLYVAPLVHSWYARHNKQGSGLLLDPQSGVLAGVVSAADGAAEQPLRVVVSSRAEGRDEVKKVLELTVAQSAGKATDTRTVQASSEATTRELAAVSTKPDSVLPSVPQEDKKVFYFEANKMLVVNVGLPTKVQQAVGQGGRLRVLLSGLPSGSGLRVDGQSGTISGIPSKADVEASPMYLTMTLMAQTLTSVITDEKSFQLHDASRLSRR
jgi:hypothetical protein